MSREVMQQALEFCEFCWRDVSMNDYALERLEQTTTALRETLDQPGQSLTCKSTQARLAASWGYVKESPGLDTSLPSLKDLKRMIRHTAKTEGYPCHFCGKHFCNHGCLKD